MSQNFIKIFDDTVLKQSINQGTEEQRTAANLGRFTMGELAFTRDTGRLFIGNHSSKPASELELPQIHGGIIAGNKYLGYIDSKPLSWWTRGDAGSLPLNYEEETTYDGVSNPNSTEDNYLKEEGLLTPKSKYRNKKDVDGNQYKEKWDKETHYNENLDAYDGDYMYDMYQNALILFDRNISESHNPPKRGTKEVTSGNITTTREIYVDDNGEELPIKEQLRRTEIKNLSQKHCIDYPVYGDGYVIFRNIEPDGKTLRFKSKSFYDDGTPISDGESFVNYSHNILEVVSVPGSAMDAGHGENFELRNDKVELKNDIKNVKSIKNDDNTITLPGILNLYNSDKTATAITLNFSNAGDRNFKTIDDESYILALKETETTNNYSVSVAKSKNTNFYIRLGEGLKNKGRGGDKLIELSSSDSSSSSNTPLLTIESDTSYLSSGYYSDPFYTNDETIKDNFYVGNTTLKKGGIVSLIDKYDEKYETATETERGRFDSPGNVAMNFFKTPIPIIWNTNSTYTCNNVNANFLFNTKPYLFCMKKDVYVNANAATNTQHENGVIVIGNNSVASKEAPSDYFFVPNYNTSKNFSSSKDKEKVIFRDYPKQITTSDLLSDNGNLEQTIGTYETFDKKYVLFNGDDFNDSFFSNFQKYLTDNFKDSLTGNLTNKDTNKRIIGIIDETSNEKNYFKEIFNENYDSLKPIIDFEIDFSPTSNENIETTSDENINFNDDIINIRIITNRSDINLRYKNECIKEVKISGTGNNNASKIIINAAIARTACENCKDVYYDTSSHLVYKRNSDDTFTASLYPNSKLLLDSNNLIAKLDFSFTDEIYDESEPEVTYTESIKLIEDVNYSKNINLIRGNDVSTSDSTTILSVSNSKIDEEDDSIIGAVILYKLADTANTDDTIKICTPNEFLTDEIISNPSNDSTISFDCGKLSESGYDFISFIMVGESDISKEVDEKEYFLTSITNVITYQLVNVYGAEKGLHEPKVYTNATIYPSSGGESTVNLDETITSSSELYGVIPYHASSIILEVRYKTSSAPNNKPLSIFTAADFDSMRDGGLPHSSIHIHNSTISSAYKSNNGTYKIEPPNSFADNAFCPEDNEKQLLYTSSSTIQTITVPLYISDYDNAKTFNLRIAGINNNSSDVLLIRAIGYNV